MQPGSTPRWLRLLERHLGWLAIPNIAVLLVTLQAAGFLLVTHNPLWAGRLALIPQYVTQGGQYWRLITWLALPLSMNIIWVFFVLWFLWSITNWIESHWGAFQTTLYILVSIGVTIAYSLATGYPVLSANEFESTLFLAAAVLFPEVQILLIIIPIKMKWLAWLTAAFLVLQFVQGDWGMRFYLLAIFSSFIVFFGPALLGRVKQTYRRYRFNRKLRD